ncbi:hypothetical protein HMPREF2531_01717 [Bacteroides intestinalis]|uniref:Uncharacterized protein n=2 Tax=Bacteroides TaxID=816 RepID=A0A139LL06_9BACE|nr:hypothetical protein BACCELL_01719 [Bacteroides cellulosilyticus DSM 14838]KXT52137.1 hypothetical protein HMPREF2531_01717 [Bacteroides intestinalis]
MNGLYRFCLCKDRNYLFDKHGFPPYLCTKNEERLHLSIIKQACFCLRFALSLQQKKEKQYKLLKP